MKHIYKLGKIYLYDNISLLGIKQQLSLHANHIDDYVYLAINTNLLNLPDHFDLYSEKDNWSHGVIDSGLIEFFLEKPKK